jgi:hypothetical protein
MADKKVERTIRPSEEDRPAIHPHSLITPGDKNGSGFPHPVDTDAKAALLEKFRVREELLREDPGEEATATPPADAGEPEASMQE